MSQLCLKSFTYFHFTQKKFNHNLQCHHKLTLSNIHISDHSSYSSPLCSIPDILVTLVLLIHNEPACLKTFVLTVPSALNHPCSWPSPSLPFYFMLIACIMQCLIILPHLNLFLSATSTILFQAQDLYTQNSLPRWLQSLLGLQLLQLCEAFPPFSL